ncbi:MAG: 4-hydroxy-tetrahydrodipicolinate reductase [Alphaproteobacteria bacterium]|nr:4-hydroxy-tetrahydrodipicolinate reductase [Alphaproteobacteria bacterium]
METVSTVKLGIAGCTGRMGQALLEAAVSAPGCRVVTGGVRAEEQAGRNMPPGLVLAHTAKELMASSDVVIDFTAPEFTVELALEAAGKALVTGTTGFSTAQQRALEEAAHYAVIVQSANFSIGVNVLEALVEQAARLLDDAYDIEVDEMHHRMKKDAPSGTALMLGRAAAQGREVDFAHARLYRKEGLGETRPRGAIGFSARRGGEVVGVHTVTFAGPGENLELTHRAFSRAIFAHGALRAARWAYGKKPGLYAMRDVLGEP